MEGAGKIRYGFAILFLCRTRPQPALIVAFDVDLVPEALDSPVNVKIKILDINFAAAGLDFLHAIQAFAHETKLGLMFCASLLMPRAAHWFVINFWGAKPFTQRFRLCI